jgi:hypothetical protein
MYRVVTKTVSVCARGRIRQVDLGPWLPLMADANKWADYLCRTGLYDAVSVQSNDTNDVALATEDDLAV